MYTDPTASMLIFFFFFFFLSNLKNYIISHWSVMMLHTVNVYATAYLLFATRKRDKGFHVINFPRPPTGDIATSFSDVLAEGECKCDTIFLLHASTEAPADTVAAQANLIHTIGSTMLVGHWLVCVFLPITLLFYVCFGLCVLKYLGFHHFL